jgi:hypothetical protein
VYVARPTRQLEVRNEAAEAVAFVEVAEVAEGSLLQTR